MNMYVGNLGQKVTESELREAFAKFGEVSSVKIIMDRFAGQSKGYAFLEMPNNSEADVAIKALNKTMLGGQPLAISQSVVTKKKDKRASRNY
ncbi:MAG: RNA-binding protein [Deltaproteobacteria bacterium RIFOXYD12_FULL_50_9]|nr:MAG: RNA-binding protein [Deltaproteobacteria bacterium RIFOXYD12_FULL_50_9]